jgi:hypothetical protein
MEMANLSNLLLKLLNKMPWRLILPGVTYVLAHRIYPLLPFCPERSHWPWLLQLGYDTSRSRLEKSLAWGTVPALQVC